MLTVITKNLFKKPKKITLARAIQIIEMEDPYITTDWHLGKFINKQQTEASYQEYIEKTKKMIDRLQKAVKPGKPMLCLGDITEEEMYDEDLIKWLYNTVVTIHGSPKILIKGNNDIFDDEFYYKLGFEYVTKRNIVSDKLRIVFSHEPVSIIDMKLSEKDWLNLHGHSHGSGKLYNMQPGDANCHLDAFPDYNWQGVQKLSYYLSMFRAHPEKYKCDVIYKYGWN